MAKKKVTKKEGISLSSIALKKEAQRVYDEMPWEAENRIKKTFKYKLKRYLKGLLALTIGITVAIAVISGFILGSKWLGNHFDVSYLWFYIPACIATLAYPVGKGIEGKC